MKKRLAAHSQTDQSCDRPLSVSAGIPFVFRAVGIGTASRKKMTGCRGIIGPIPQPLVIRYSDVGTHSSIKEVFVNRFSEHFSEHFFLLPKRGKPPGESPEKASSGRPWFVSGFQIGPELPPAWLSPPQDRESAFRKNLPFMHRRRGFSSGIFPLPLRAVRQHSTADRLILLSSIRSLCCRPGIPAPRLRPGSRHHRLCPASPESGPPIPVPSSVVFPYPAYEFPPLVPCRCMAVLCIMYCI